ncbi:hypothetical protein IPV08_23935 [Methylobacterium sp. SD274]|uniref:hypothetical protein n=1 Tax=Methylobacterium sp. SD274 TaxID=2782009 RepID=UPI001A979115|nr:hypothetical protein [Methylobacterium sp. SD274]MBO1023010.1 hypothetical protein [Methylobacterium sp. SD274]
MTTPDLLLLELRDQIVELQTRLAIGQEDLIEMACDAGRAQGEIIALQDLVAELRMDRDAWKLQAEHLAFSMAPRRSAS